jgi:hypothetical protein
MAKLLYKQSELPPFDSDYMNRLAMHLWQWKLYWHDARRPLEVKWRECDEAYLCYRRLPDSGGMDWIDDSDMGETDIFDNVNKLAEKISNALMPRGYTWLTVTSRQDEAQDVIQAIQDQQIYMHRKAKTRRAFERVIKQNIIRGTTALIWAWRDNERIRRLSSVESSPLLKKHLKAMGADPKDINKALGKQARIKEVTFSGPQIRPLDVFDLWIDPHLDMTNTAYPATIVQTFNYLPDLVDAKDDYGNDAYQNLEGLTPFSVEQIYAWDNNFRTRAPEVIGTSPIFGTYPARITGFTKLVPVYIFHFPYLKFEGEEFYDTYFHVALNNGFRWPRIIKVEENPSDSGHPHVLVDNYIDWFTNIGYGISGVEKALTYYRQKNVLQAVMLNAAVATQFPANLVYADAFRDENDISYTPGYSNIVSHNPLGLAVIAPVPVPATGLQLAFQDMKFWGSEIRTKMGIDGLTTDSATRAMSSRKTATEVTSDESSGSSFIDNAVEKFSDMLTELCQGVYESSRKNLIPDAQGNLVYEKALQDRIQEKTINYQDFANVERTIQVNGVLGALNKGMEMQQLIQAAQMTQEIGATLPNAPMVLQKLWVEILSRLNVTLDPQDMMSPMQLAAANPQVQMAALQSAMQNPEIVQAFQEQQHKARQLSFDQANTPQQQGAPPNEQNGQAPGNQGAQTIPSQGF